MTTAATQQSQLIIPNPGYCGLTGHCFPGLEAGDDCPHCTGLLDTLPDRGHWWGWGEWHT